MFLPSLKGWLTALAFVGAVLLLKTEAKAEIRRNPAGTAASKPASAKNEANEAPNSKSANNAPSAREDEELAADDLSSDKPKGKPGAKDAANKKSKNKGTKEKGSMTRTPSRRPRSDNGGAGGSVLMGSGLNLEPET